MRQVRRGVFETNSSSQHSIVVMKNQGTFEGKYTDKQLNTGIYVRNGTWDIWNDDDLEFGRGPFNILCTPGEKLRYAITSYCAYYQDYREANEEFNKLKELAKKILEPIGVVEIKVPEKFSPIYRDKKGNRLHAWEVEFKKPTVDSDDISDKDDDDSKNYSDYTYCYKDGDDWVPAVRDREDDEEVPYYGCIDHQSDGLLQSFLKKSGVSLEDFITNKKYLVVIDGDEYCQLWKFLSNGLMKYDDIDTLYCDGHSHKINDELKKEVTRIAEY